MTSLRNRKISTLSMLSLEVWNCGLFALIWLLVYNELAFDTHAVQGACITILIYCILYNVLCHVYRAFKIASTSIVNILFSQFISFSLADLIMWIECCLMHRDYVDILPGCPIVVAQLAGTIILVIIGKRLLMRYLVPKRTVLVYGTLIDLSEVKCFERKLLDKYAHLYRIDAVVCENRLVVNGRVTKLLKRIVANAETIILYEVPPETRQKVFQRSMRLEKEIIITPSLDDIFLQGFSSRPYIDTPVFKFEYSSQNEVYHAVKRGLDIVISLAFIVLLSWLYLLVALCIKIEDRGPVFYTQRRCTKGGKVFRILKFRSMVVDAEKFGVIPSTQDDPRITRVGRVIRPTRIDELPQLFNILAGHMSWVGPRPERVEHVRAYTRELPEFSYRMLVRGGLTGYAQIYGKYNTSAYDKLRLDLIYIENESFLFDLRIMLLTVKTLFTPEATEGFSEQASREMMNNTHELRDGGGDDG